MWTLPEGAVLLESGLEVELTGIALIGNRVMEDDELLGLVFSTEITGGEIKINSREILDIKWFTYDEILNMKDELRTYNLIVNSLYNYVMINIGVMDFSYKHKASLL